MLALMPPFDFTWLYILIAACVLIPVTIIILIIFIYYDRKDKNAKTGSVPPTSSSDTCP